MDQQSGDGGAENASDSGCILRVDLIKCSDRMDMGRDRGAQDDSKVFGLAQMWLTLRGLSDAHTQDLASVECSHNTL